MADITPSTFNLVDFFAGFTAASSAGKLPSTQQSNDLAEWLLKSPLLQVEAKVAGSGGKLSENGTAIVRDLREIVEAYQAAAVEKNGDNILQDALHALGRAGRAQYNQKQQPGGNNQPRKSEAAGDAQDFVGALRVAFEMFFGGFGWQGEAAHLTRLTGADLAEAIQQTAGDLKDHLRETDQQAQNRAEESERIDAGQSQDTKQQFEQSMDTAKATGSQVIGAVQTVQGRAGDISDNAVSRLNEAAYRIAEQAQNDPEYRRAIDTLFSIYDKYKARTIDRAQRVQSQSEDGDVEDELAEILGGGEVPGAIKKLRILAERFAGGKSLQDILAAAAACGADVHEDPDVRRGVDDWEAFVRKSLDEPGYIQSDEYKQRRQQLSDRWQEVRNRDSEVGRKWNTDVDRLRQVTGEFAEAVQKDGSIQRLKNAHIALAKHFASAVPTIGKVAFGQASWVWQDLSDVLLPRIFAILKEIPFPRTEYVDAESEFVLENLSLQSLQLLPGHIHITNQTSVDIDAPGPAAGENTTNITTKTRVKFTGVQLALKQVSFYYRDKTSYFGPSTVTGLLDVTIPEKGVDFDVQVVLLPTASGHKERRERHGFHRIEHLSVSLDDVSLAISQSNHPIITTLFQSAVRTGLIRTIRTTLEEYLRVALEAIDGIAWDTHARAQVFADAGAPSSLTSHVLGFISVLGRLAREESLFAGVQTTSVGIVKDDPQSDKAFAIGAAPQILDANKRGPVANQPGGAGDGYQGGPRSNQAVNVAASAAQKLQGEGVPAMAQSYVETVARKREAEKRSEGWRSSAFDLPVSQRT